MKLRSDILKPRLKISILGKKVHAFHFFGALGLLAAITLALFLTWFKQLSINISLLLIVLGMFVFFIMVYLYKKITGREDMVYYQHEIVIMLSFVVFLSLIGQPILPYLDISLLSIGIMMAFGRWGCFSVGCCHGYVCNCKYGVVYSEDHAKKGFPSYYVGARLFPSPIVESFFVLSIIAFGIYFMLNDYAHGTVLIWYSVVYGLIRFLLESFRGDPERPYLLSFSEAQWTTLGIMGVLLILNYYNLLPYYSWHYIISLSVFFGVLFYVFLKIVRNTKSHLVLKTSHINELYQLLQRITFMSDAHDIEKIKILVSSEKVSVSFSKIEENGAKYLYYTFSLPQKSKINKRIINTFSAITENVDKHNNNSCQVILKSPNLFHLIFKI